MTGLFYLSVGILALCGIWLVWELGFKAVFLDGFRQRLFELRLALFSLAESGELSFNDDAYRAVETLLNGLIRFAHKMSFIGYLYSAWENSRAEKEDPDYVNFGNVLALKISRLKPEAQRNINIILTRVHAALSVFMAANSLAFKLIAVAFYVHRLFHRKAAEEKLTQQVYVIEREAYYSERRGSAYSR